MGTHYIFKHADMTEEQVLSEKQHFIELGFKVIIFVLGKDNIHEGLKKVISNHIQ